MKRSGIILLNVALLISLSSINFAQGAQSADEKYVSRTTLAVRYVENKKTTVNLTGTPLAPRIAGRVEVEYKKNDARIKIKVENLDHPQTFGPYYTTYVAWAVTPEGQTENLAVFPNGYTVELQAMSSAQTFGVIITAEPHSEVKMPSQKVVAETTLPKNVTSGVQTIQAEYRADSGRLYEGSDSDSTAMVTDYNTPRLVLGARRSLDIARRAGAKEYAAEEWQQAQSKLGELDQIWPKNMKNETKFSGLARDVMRLGQVARELATQREYQARIENERQARLRNLEEARAQAERAKAEAERERLAAERAKAEAEKAKAEAERSARTAEEERQRRDQASREAEAAKARAEAEKLAADKARQQAEDAKRERDAAQQKLFVSLSEVLDTKRESRGLIVNLGDVLFDTGKATLKPTAREKLSKLAGILLAYPGDLKLEIEGHTDSTGSDELNNKLSLDRAQSVRNYMVEAGVKAERIKNVQGFGKTKPIATNDTAAGRQMNRRVEVVIDDSEQGK